MKSTLAKKIIFLGFSCALAALALTVIENLISDRLIYQEQAKGSVANSWSGAQQLSGPLLAVPYKYRVTTQHWNEKLGKNVRSQAIKSSMLYIIPDRLEINTDMTTQERYRGIFSFPVFTGQLKVSGKFDLAPLQKLKNRLDLVEAGVPFIAVSVSDIRGINNKPMLTWQGREYSFRSGSRLAFNPQGVHVPLENIGTAPVEFKFELSLRGMDTLWFTPVGKDSKVNLSASWPHPNFVGQFLPAERVIEDGRFNANWQVSEFSSNIGHDVDSCERGNCGALVGNRFGVSLNEPVNIYRQAIRSAKYGMLFVGLTFISFFIFEVLKRLQIHPIQYTLVGLALSVFYLLLIALSEHLSFLVAYGIATSACVCLLTAYVTAIIKSFKWGVGFGGFVAVLYGLLYVILSSEDHALLLGSLLVFLALTLVMLSTRHLDWYQVSGWAADKAKEQLKKAAPISVD
ncbi:cell envelope integrity protein CreD [Motiliproteus sp. MSK22-1]|uniref:cell envelope integrity protein CreD n=1 Tax=Motiliproteus sp. MSK22-1 TaxID=1897630 RepID=UPI000975530F|nr:cell envelope integrity protein CreD [Motiliproteus sp. MSK22-1]OMH31718.1 hypothetical protein BGP75_16480 [Motiliproteus sp. MSK22-1]